MRGPWVICNKSIADDCVRGTCRGPPPRGAGDERPVGTCYYVMSRIAMTRRSQRSDGIRPVSCVGGQLPVQFPADMNTVEKQFEDTPRDLECYRDADGNVYDFAYGLNWNGVINDDRVKKYR